MLGIIHRMYDLTPNSPVTVTDGVSVSCSNVRTLYPIGSEYVRHAFIVLQDADIVVKNAEGNTLQRGTDYFTISRAMDQLYSKQYSTSVFSGIQFKATGTYTVTSFLSCGTYPRASWYNYALETLLAVINTSIPALQAAVNNFSSSLSDMTETVMQIAQTVTSHGTRLTVLESNPTIIVVADHATMIALTGIKTGTTVYVVADTDGKRAEYLYDGAAFQKTSDPDWENINIDWSALLNIPTGVAALIAGTLASTALADMPTPADTDDAKVLSWDKTTGKYKLLSVSAAAGVGDVSSNSSASTAGHIAQFSNASGKIIEDGGLAPSDLYASRCATISVTTADVTISDNHDGTLILSGALTGNRIVYLPAAVWRKTIICNCTGSYYVSVLATGQTTGGAYLAAGDVGDIYCDGSSAKLIGIKTPRIITMTRSGNLSVTANTDTLVTFAAATGDTLGEFGSNAFTAKHAGTYDVALVVDIAGTGISGTCMATILINDVAVRYTSEYIASAEGVTVVYFNASHDIKLKAGDVVTFKVKIGAGTSIVVRSWSMVLIAQIN